MGMLYSENAKIVNMRLTISMLYSENAKIVNMRLTISVTDMTP